MLKENSMLRREASEALAGNWGMAAVVALIYLCVSVTAQLMMDTTDGVGNLYILGLLLSLFICTPLVWGMYMVFYEVCRSRKLELGILFDGFKDYGRVFGTMFLMGLYTVLWSLLLFVPGVIKACSYAMTPFILRDDPGLSYNAAIEKSMAMMEGHKMKYFLLCLSFIGWFLLCLLSLGIGFLFLIPYVSTANAAFYEDLKREAIQGGNTDAEEDAMQA